MSSPDIRRADACYDETRLWDVCSRLSALARRTSIAWPPFPASEPLRAASRLTPWRTWAPWYTVRKIIPDSDRWGLDMLKRFSVCGYRSFDCTTTLDFSKTRDYKFNEQDVRNGIVNNGLIIGQNASGKSNLARAISDIGDVFYRATWGDASEEDPLFLNADNGSGYASFEYVFQFGEQEVSYLYDRTPDGAFLHEMLRLDGSVVFDFDNYDSRLREGDLSLVGAQDINWEYDDAYLCLLSYIINTVPRGRLGVLDDLSRFVGGLQVFDLNRLDSSELRSSARLIVQREKTEEFEEFLRRFGIDEHLVEVTDPDGRKALYSEHSQRLIPFAEASSSGTRMLMRLYTKFVLKPTRSLCFFDEFDAYCHFEMAEELVRFFGELEDCQTICSTHNTGLVKNDVMRPDCVFLLSRDKTLASLSDRTSRELRQGHNIEKLYRNGEFS